MMIIQVFRLVIFVVSIAAVEGQIYNDKFKSSIYKRQQHEQQPNIAHTFLESMEDLEHISYLSMRNFNMTDEGLLQSTWLYGLSSNNYALAHHKQHQKVASMLLNNVHPSSLSTDSAPNDNNMRAKLSIMLESFIAHLRNGHLRRLSLEELELVVQNLIKDQTELDPQQQHPPESKVDNVTTSPAQAAMTLAAFSDTYNHSAATSTLSVDSNTKPPDRCYYLVMIYKYELMERQRLYKEPQRLPDLNRLTGLCNLVVRCNTAEELVNLISGPWQSMGFGDQEPDDGSKSQKKDQNSLSTVNQRQQRNKLSRIINNLEASSNDNNKLPSSLRDSLSLSLAKLCPLILFQLHDDGGFCTVRKDDRPPMITVWGFATLFVTIVSFCSLIGLSITPLLGSTKVKGLDDDDVDDDGNLSSSSSTTSSRSSTSKTMSTSSKSSSPSTSAGNNSFKLRQVSHHQHRNNKVNQSHHNKACLTLFEGLAVGSLVGSALFSLIPQAFELQERESNQGFLLKALIIFFGIYLFFCSERIMRIILDTRQRKKKMKLHCTNHPSSNSIPPQAGITPPVIVVTNSNNDAELVTYKQQQIQFNRYQRIKPSVLNPSRTLPSKNSFGPKRPVDQQQKVVNFSQPAVGLNPADSKVSSKKQIRRSRKSRQQLLKRQRRRYLSSQNHGLMQQLPLRINTESDNDDRDAKPNQHLKPKSRQLSSSISSLTSDVQRKDIHKGSLEELDESFAYQTDDKLKSLSDWTDSDDDELKLKMRAVNEQMLSRQRMMLNHDQTRGKHGNFRTRFHHHSSNQSTDFIDNKKRNSTQYSNSHEGTHKHHSHQHDDLTELRAPKVKQDISTVAWMIILGDGLHNFIDGISIGAAFSESILSGVSISVAVICEEFPHELGDFAVLVSSGMTVRQALGYNFLSACTCYFGMAIGIILGDVNDSASYISALAAGVFLYIALVDMMGELSATLEETSRDSITKTLKLLLLQNIGIFIGISIIFILSFIDF